MVALNILFILLGFINSINRKPRNLDITQGEIVFSDDGDGPGDPLPFC